jgi:hypothetical protein
MGEYDDIIADFLRIFDNAPADAQYSISASDYFTGQLKKIIKKDGSKEERIYKRIKQLWYAKIWKPGKKESDRKTNRIGRNPSGYDVYKTRVTKAARLFFALIDNRGDRRLPIIVLESICVDHDKAEQEAKRALLHPANVPNEEDVIKEPKPDKMTLGEMPGTGYRTIGNLSSLHDMIEWLESHANIRITPEQLKRIMKKPPILIDGQAGTGKTSVLAIRASAMYQHAASRGETFDVLCTCYNKHVLELIRKWIDAHLAFTFKKNLEHNISFEILPKIFYMYLPNNIKSKYEDPEKRPLKRKVGFSHFSREFYNKELTRKSQLKRLGLSAELAWHAIRSILKGMRLEGEPFKLEDIPVHSSGEHRLTKKETQDFNGEQWKEIFRIYVLYEKWKSSKQLYDDMDLAFDAFRTIGLATKNVYDEIYIDEGQDLTKIEIELLRKFQKNKKRQLIIAGDPLQTVNPTGFDWDRIRALLYDPKEKIDDVVPLECNFRTPENIVEFSNKIQEFRAHYKGTKPAIQTAYKKGGEKPVCLNVDSERDRKALRNLLRDVPADTAIIVWARDDDEILELLKSDSDYKTVWDEIVENEGESYDFDEKLMVFTVSDIKGLEHDKIILYKFCQHDQFKKWISYMVQKLETEKEPSKQIPVLYHLNRLFISSTRSANSLYIVDNDEGFEKLWKQESWKDLLNLERLPVPDGAAEEFESPAFREGGDYLEDAEKYLDKFHGYSDKRMVNFAEQSCLKAPNGSKKTKMLNLIRAEKYEFIATKELPEGKERNLQLANAAKCWHEYGQMNKAVLLYYEAGFWKEALRTINGISTLNDVLRLTRLDLKFRIDNKSRTKDLKEHVNYISSNKEKYVLEYQSQHSMDVMFESKFRLFIELLVKKKMWIELEQILGEVLWKKDQARIDGVALLCTKLLEKNEVARARSFIEKNGLENRLEKLYIRCLERDIQSAPFRSKKAINLHDRVIRYSQDPVKRQKHREYQGLHHLGNIVSNNKKKLRGKKRVELFFPDSSERKNWIKAQNHLSFLDLIDESDEIEVQGKSIDLRILYLAKAWSSYDNDDKIQCIVELDKCRKAKVIRKIDSKSYDLLKLVNEDITKLYGNQKIIELVWYVSSMRLGSDAKKLGNSAEAIRAMINSGIAETNRIVKLEERMLALSKTNSYAEGIMIARNWMIKRYRISARRDKKQAKILMEIYLKNRNWGDAKDFADRFSNILERKMNYEIDARYIENVEMDGSPSEADRNSLENLAKLYQKAGLQEHSERITGLIPHDPAAELDALLSSEQAWDIKLKNIRSIISSEAKDGTIRKLWKSASAAMAKDPVNVYDSITDENRFSPLGWKTLFNAHGKKIEKVLGKITIPKGSVILEFACPEQRINMEYVCRINRLNEPAIMLPILEKNCQLLDDRIRAYMREDRKKYSELWKILYNLTGQITMETLELDTIKKEKSKKPDDISLQIGQLCGGISIHGLGNERLIKIFKSRKPKLAESKIVKMRKHELVCKILEAEYGKPGDGGIITAFETMLSVKKTKAAPKPTTKMEGVRRFILDKSKGKDDQIGVFIDSDERSALNWCFYINRRGFGNKKDFGSKHMPARNQKGYAWFTYATYPRLDKDQIVEEILPHCKRKTKNIKIVEDKKKDPKKKKG